jgi:two-component system nitrate/nitrite response regulator NarL
LETVHRTAIDVVLLDLDLGEQQGGAFLNHFRQVGCKSKVLVVTAGVGSREAAWLKNRGCSGIFLKHEPLSKLLGEIRAIFVGVEPEPEGPGEPPEAVRSQRQRALTAREREVLRAVCEGLSNKMIGSRLGVTENSIKSMIQQLFAKTGVRTRAQLVRAAIEQYWNELEPD